MITFDDIKKRSLITNNYTLPYNPILNDRAKQMRKNMTFCERKMWIFLKKLNYRVLRQKIIDNYIVDFYCAKLKLIIEIDGEVHNLDNNIGYDNLRDNILRNYGLRIIRIKNMDILNNFNNVCEFIKTEINKSEIVIS